MIVPGGSLDMIHSSLEQRRASGRWWLAVLASLLALGAQAG